MLLNETTVVDPSALPVARLKDHLRLSSGFAEDQIQDNLLAVFLRAALATIEARTGKALLAREFTLSGKFGSKHRIPLMVAPVVQVIDITQADSQNLEIVTAELYDLEQDHQAPALLNRGLPAAELNIRFTAGYGAAFDDVPADLAQAVMLLAAHYYEYRNETALGSGCMPFGVSALIERYRPLRIGLGASA